MRRQKPKPSIAVPVFFAVVTAVVTLLAFTVTSSREQGQDQTKAERPFYDAVVGWLAERLGSGGVLALGGALTIVCLVPLFLRARSR